MLFQYYPYYSGRGLWQTLIDWGFVDALLPFILLFALLFGILQKVPLFKDDQGKPDRRINGILAMIISAMVVVPHIVGLYPPQSDPINIINQFLPAAAVILVAILCIILLLGLSGTTIPNTLLWTIALVGVGFLVFIILVAMVPGFMPAFGFLSDPTIQALLIVLLTMGLVAYFIVREPTSQKKWKDVLTEWLGGGP